MLSNVCDTSVSDVNLEYTFNIGFCLDTLEMVPFKLSMTRDTAKLYRLIPV